MSVIVRAKSERSQPLLYVDRKPPDGGLEKPFSASPFSKGSQVPRLNERYRRIIAANLPHIAGKRVIDLGAHDGRWTWAALEAGARHVAAVEGRKGLAGRARHILKQRDNPIRRWLRPRWSVAHGDVYEFLQSYRRPADTILCLGLLYHVSDHLRLLSLMERLGPRCIIIDSALLTTPDLTISYRPEKTDDMARAIPTEKGNESELVGIMSQGLLAQWCELNGWSLDYVSWQRNECEHPAAVVDYFQTDKAFARFTCVLTR